MFNLLLARLLCAFAVAWLAGLSGCASPGEKMVESYSTTRRTLAESQSHVDGTLMALLDLRRMPAEALKDAYGRYKEHVSELEKDAQQAKWRAKEMADEQDAHIKAWQKEMASIDDPTMKSSLESRRQAAATNYKLVRMYADDVRKAYEPFLQRNQQMVQALSIDLSPAALKSLAPSIDQINADSATLKQKIWLMQHAMDNIANGVSPIGT